MIGNGLNINNYMCRWGPRYQSISCKAITTKTPPQLLFMFIIKLMIICGQQDTKIIRIQTSCVHLYFYDLEEIQCGATAIQMRALLYS